MLDHLGLVHMNARIYDPVIGRFLSPDSVLQFPGNIQSYDRYQYVLNNPVSFTDPSGHFIPLIVGIIMVAQKVYWVTQIIVMAITTAAWAALNGATGADVWKAGLLAAGTAAIAFGVGNLFGSVGDLSSASVNTGSVATQELARAAAHGITGGVASEISGGSFGTGFAASFVGSAAGSAMEATPLSGFFGGQSGAAVFRRTTAVAIIGGTAAEIGGGKFANGAATSAIQHLFNHEVDWAAQSEEIVVSEVEFEDAPVFEVREHNRTSKGAPAETQPKLRFRYTQLEDGTYKVTVSLSVDVTLNAAKISSDAMYRSALLGEYQHYKDAVLLYNNRFRTDVNGLIGQAFGGTRAFSKAAGGFYRIQWKFSEKFWDDSGYHNIGKVGFKNRMPSYEKVKQFRLKRFGGDSL